MHSSAFSDSEATAQTTAFVAGATGFTGREVVRFLREKGIPVHAHIRPDSPRLAEWAKTFLALGAVPDATPWDAKAMKHSLTRIRPDVVFSLLGTTKARKAAAQTAGKDVRVESYETVDYGLTAILLKACVDAEISPRFVYLSAMGTNAQSTGAYGKARWKAEEAVRRSGLPYIIARPAFIIGPGRDEPRKTEALGAGLIDGALGLAGAVGFRSLRERYRSITNTQLAKALVFFALDFSTSNAVIEADRLRKVP